MTYHGCSGLTGLVQHCSPGHTPDRGDRFGRMFPHLPPNYVPADLLQAIGRSGGPMDGGSTSDRTAGVAVGQVIFGQFIDHDITLDVTSSLTRNGDAAETPNLRTPTLDLDCIYGDGPESHPYLYAADGIRLLTGADVPGATIEQQNDLLRSANGRAIIGDPRNDENRIVSQMQLGMIRFHNDRAEASMDAIRAAHPGADDDELDFSGVFEATRRLVTWHYQWCVVFDFLAAMCGKPVVDDVLANGRKLYCHVTEPYIPVEFSVAAYRFGHSMVPMKIQVQKGRPALEFFGSKLGHGFAAVASTDAIVDWHELFDTPAGRIVQRAEKLDTKMAGDLLDLPFITDDEASLATRNLLRGNVFRLPSGEAAAALIDLADDDIDPVRERVEAIAEEARDGSAVISELGDGSPLWLYLLAEAEVLGRAARGGGFDPGEGLGPLGARIVAEVIIGLLELDEHSFLGANRNWTPQPEYDSIGKILASTNWDGLPG